MIDLAIEAAVEAGKFLRSSIGNVRAIETKAGEERNLVSEIDRGSEERIIGMIRSRYPDHGILAEEGGGGGKRGEYTWIIDPLDGTTNFLHGLPVFSVTIGIEHRGEIVAGVVYDPNLDILYCAEKGSGAYMNGRRMRASRTSELINSLLMTGFPYDIAQNPAHAVEHFVEFLMAARGIRRFGSAALDLCYVAAGRLDGFWEVNLHPWDMAAGVLLVTEAGGTVSDFQGKPLSIYGKKVVASNGAIHRAMLDILGRHDP
ncbi:MAG TPA: inositol monophosphatase family protein [Bacteroidota bacterium]|nr:inositol monophosphatase family protein [Bacteroidota bacterium]